MIRAIEFWFLIWTIITVGFPIFWYSTRQEKVDLLKMFCYAGLTATVATIIVSIIVVFFN